MTRANEHSRFFYFELNFYVSFNLDSDPYSVQAGPGSVRIRRYLHFAKTPQLDLSLNLDPKHCEQLVTLYLEGAVDNLTAVIVRRWMACLRCCMMWNYTRPRKKARTPARPHTAVHLFTGSLNWHCLSLD